MDTLHKNSYSIEVAMCSLVPSSGPVLCRDEMEEWSASEANLFEEALEKYGKDFTDIRNDFVSTSTYHNKYLLLLNFNNKKKTNSFVYVNSCHGKR
jgi:metastasis-associated protein MTA